MQITIFSKILGVSIGWILCFIVRLFPWRPPNIEPVLASTIAIASTYGRASSFFFPASIMVMFDLLLGEIGLWTIETAVVYGIVGLLASMFFGGKKRSVMQAVIFSIVATLFYDSVTAAIGPLEFGMSWKEAYIGQIPFTVNHVIGNIVFCLTLTPLLRRILFIIQKFDRAHMQAEKVC